MALRILQEWFKPDDAKKLTVSGLKAHQIDAINRLRATLEQRGGALLADSVGLGKTHIAIQLIDDAVGQGDCVLIVVPAALRSHWKRHLSQLLGARAQRCVIASHTALSIDRQPAIQPQFVVVDEAHQFRNPGTRRYRALRILVRKARTLLISATPINNRLDDLVALISIFADDAGFRDLGVASLRGAFAQSSPHAHAQIDRITDAVMVRRTRQAMQSAGPAFPQRVESRLHYDLERCRELLSLIDALELAWNDRPAAGTELVRLQLLKRLESSTVAFHSSAKRLLHIAEDIAQALRAGLEPRIAAVRTNSRSSDHQLSFLELLCVHDGTTQWSLPAVERDVQRLHDLVALARDSGDPKLRALQDWLATVAGERVVLFTQFRDTAEYLYSKLQSTRRAALITGDSARLGGRPASRMAVIDSFAPRANQAADPLIATDLLICTDVLAEGMNLQDAGVIVNYDLTWNPVTMLQRVGRIDRIGSPHQAIQVASILPDRSLEYWLGLVATIERKLRAIERTVGQDSAVLARDSCSALRNALHPSNRPAAEPTLAERLEKLRTLVGHSPESAATSLCAMAIGPPSTLFAVRCGETLRFIIRDHEGVTENLERAVDLIEAALDDQTSRSQPEVDWEPAFKFLRADALATELRSPDASATDSPVQEFSPVAALVFCNFSDRFTR